MFLNTPGSLLTLCERLPDLCETLRNSYIAKPRKGPAKFRKGVVARMRINNSEISTVTKLTSIL
jgi:hypothetical protein